MTSKFRHITPVLPTSNLERDIKWYHDQLGFNYYMGQDYYAVLHRDDQWVHLHWHADTEEDPLRGGSVMKIFVDDIHPILEELLERGTVTKDKLRIQTPWNTNEFGFYDLNKNAIFFVADVI